MPGLSRQGQAKVVKLIPGRAQQRRDRCPTVQMRAMAAPAADDAVAAGCQIKDGLVIGRTDRVGFGPHHARIGGAEGEDVGHGKAAKAQRPRPPFTTLDRGVVLHLGRGRGVQHHEQRPLPRRPVARQGIAVAAVGRIDRHAGGVTLLVLADDHRTSVLLARAGASGGDI